MDILNTLKDKVDSLNLNERALQTLSKIKKVDSEDDLFPEFLKGFSRDEIIFKTKQQVIELYNFSGFDPSILTIIGIYVLDIEKKWADNLKPIGYFEFQTDINGEYLNDHLEIEEQKYSS